MNITCDSDLTTDKLDYIIEQIKKQKTYDDYISIPVSKLTNEVVYKLWRYKISKKLEDAIVCEILCFLTNTTLNSSGMKATTLKILRMYNRVKKMNVKKRETIIKDTFSFAVSHCLPSPKVTKVIKHTIDAETQTFTNIRTLKCDFINLNNEIKKKTRYANKLDNTIVTKRELLSNTIRKQTIYSPRNVRREKYTFLKLKSFREKNKELNIKVLKVEDTIEKLQKQVMFNKLKIKRYYKFRHLYKQNSKYIRKLRFNNRKKTANTETQETNVDVCNETFKNNGIFNDSIRLCVLELLGLEVAVHKIAEVIKVVGRHVFNKILSNDCLPSSSTIINISDEGQYLAKLFIADKINATNHFGLSKDGTSRQKVKILENTLTMSDGKMYPMGFHKVARETAEDISNGVKMELAELSAILTENDVNSKNIKDGILSKLSYFMTDRAANEKLSNTT